MNISDIDVEARTDELVLSQYKESENLKKYIKCFVKPLQKTFGAIDLAKETREIDRAFGDSLDKIAKVVGEARVVRGAKTLGLFGFDETVDGLPLGVGTFYSYGEKLTGDLVLSDKALRSLIRGRIMLNTGKSTVEFLLRYFETLVGRSLNTEVVEDSAKLVVKIHEDLDASERLLLSLRAYPAVAAGVKLTLEDNTGEIVMEVPKYA